MQSRRNEMKRKIHAIINTKENKIGGYKFL